MPKKEAKFKSEDGTKTMRVTIQDLSELTNQSTGGGSDVQAYQSESEEFIIENGNKRLTITIAE